MADGDSVWLSLGKFVMQLFLNKVKEDDEKGDKRELAPTELNIVIPVDGPADDKPVPEKGPDMEFLPNVDWSNPESMVSKHFTVKETCWLPSWQVIHIPSEEEKQNILKQAAKMDLIRDFLGVPINVHCWIRPILNNPASEYHGRDYNGFVHGAKNSSHKIGLATDYDAVGHKCIDIINEILDNNKLEELQLRMENNGSDPSWIHLDSSPVITRRYFNP